MKPLSVSAFAAVLFAAAMSAPAAIADATTLDAPLKGVTLQSDDVDMSLYFTEIADGGFKVVATYLSDTAPDQPERIVMKLFDGDSVKFGLPGTPANCMNLPAAVMSLRFPTRSSAAPDFELTPPPFIRVNRSIRAAAAARTGTEFRQTCYSNHSICGAIVTPNW